MNPKTDRVISAELNFRRRADGKCEGDQALLGGHNRNWPHSTDGKKGSLKRQDRSGGGCGVSRDADRARRRFGAI